MVDAPGIGRAEPKEVAGKHTAANDILTLLNPIADASYARDLKGLIRQIRSWVDSKTLLKAQECQHVMWIYGYVGCGKSSIAQAIAEVYARKNRLVASFFFFRGAGDRSTAKRFARTLASQFIAAIPATAPLLEEAVRTHAGLLTTYTLAAQFEHLIFRPLMAFVKLNPLRLSYLRHPYLIVVDGLDECEDREEIAAFIELTLTFFKTNPRFPLRFLVTSRVEEHLQTRMHSKQVYLLNLVDRTALEDVSSVLQASFALASKHDRVIRAYGDWPSPEDRQKLVEHSGGSIIFMSTILKFILGSSEDGLTRLERLPLALKINPGLDGLYRETLSRAENLPHFSSIVTAIIIFDAPPTIVELGAFLGIQTFEVLRVLVNLHSILHVPGDDYTPVTICHTSLRDFLQDESRSQRFHISSDSEDSLYRQFLARPGNKSLLRVFTTMPLLMGVLSIHELTYLLNITTIILPQYLQKFALDAQWPIDWARALILRPSLGEYLRRESRSSFRHTQLLAYDCFRVIYHDLPSGGSNVLNYAQSHAMEHWNAFLRSVPPSLSQPVFGKVVSNPRLLFSPHPMVDTALLLLLSLEGDAVAEKAGVSLSSLLESLPPGLKVRKGTLIAEVMVSFGRRCAGSLGDIEAAIFEGMLYMGSGDLKVVASAHFELLSLRERRTDTPLDDSASPALFSNQSDKANLKTIVKHAVGSPMFIVHFTKFIMDVRDRPSLLPLPPIGTTIRNALASTIPLEGLYTRLLAQSGHPDPRLSTLISTISSLAERFTIFQLSHFLGVPMQDIRSVLRGLRGIVRIPSDDSTDIVLPGPFLTFLQKQRRAGRCSSPHEELAKRCLRVWFEWNTDIEELASVRDYCQTHWIFHWEAAQILLPMSRGAEVTASVVRMLSDVCSFSVVEVALRTKLQDDDGFLTIVQTLSNGGVDRLEPDMRTLGCKHDVSEVGRRHLLICAQALLALERHYHPLEIPLAAADLVDGPVAESLSLCDI